MTVEANRRATAASIAAIGVVTAALALTGWRGQGASISIDASTAGTASVVARATVDQAIAAPGSTVNGAPDLAVAKLGGDRSATPFAADGPQGTGARPSEPHTRAAPAHAEQNGRTSDGAASGPRTGHGQGSDGAASAGASGIDAEAHAPAPELGQSPAPGLDSSPALRFVYFVEADQEYDPTAPDLIESQARALQLFWYEQFGGTFALRNQVVEVVYGRHDAAWYDTNEAGGDPRWFRLTNIRAEIRATLGIKPDESIRMITYPAARIDGRVGANRYDGAWMDGDDMACIDGSVTSTPYSAEFPANCLTTVAHELGHVYGLGHEGEEADCMQFGFYQYVLGTARCDFADAHRQAVVDDPLNVGWLDARPGDQGL